MEKLKMENGKWKMENLKLKIPHPSQFNIQNSTFNITTTLPIQHSTFNITTGSTLLPGVAVDAWQGIDPKPERLLGRRPDNRVRLSDKTNVPGTKWHPLEKESGKTPCDINSKFNITTGSTLQQLRHFHTTFLTIYNCFSLKYLQG